MQRWLSLSENMSPFVTCYKGITSFHVDLYRFDPWLSQYADSAWTPLAAWLRLRCYNLNATASRPSTGRLTLVHNLSAPLYQRARLSASYNRGTNQARAAIPGRVHHSRLAV